MRFRRVLFSHSVDAALSLLTVRPEGGGWEPQGNQGIPRSSPTSPALFVSSTFSLDFFLDISLSVLSLENSHPSDSPNTLGKTRGWYSIKKNSVSRFFHEILLSELYICRNCFLTGLRLLVPQVAHALSAGLNLMPCTISPVAVYVT